MPDMSFVSELRRRQVFRTAAWYGGLAWAAIEIANTVFPQFGLPGWSVRAVIVAAVLGLPVVETQAIEKFLAGNPGLPPSAITGPELRRLPHEADRDRCAWSSFR